MATPPSSLPSPTPSSSSHSHFQSLSNLQPSRAASAASGISYNSASGRDSGLRNFGNSDNLPPSTGYGGDYPHHTPQAQMPNHIGPYNSSVPASFLPPVTSSPPPHPPPYVPPPQHAMAPDPIHTLSAAGSAPGIMGMSQPFPGPGGPAPWQNGPGPNGWRGPPTQGGYPGQPQPQPQLPYGRPGLPNGHGPASGSASGMPIGHGQLPSNPIDNFASAAGRGSFSGAGIGAGGLGPRPGSSHGENRERRSNRDRERRETKDEDKDDEEVISTIFVVGFPDDMPEREFQNIFTFAPGFEAATLKFPSGSSRREPTAALLAELTQLAANQAQAQAAAAEQGLEYAITQPALEEAMAAMSMAAASGTATTSASTTPSAAMSLTPSAPSGPLLGNAPSLPSRRQTIGFARFKTRADALAAREHLQGRKIDSLTGATLKAEMAKKNLHTKRATSGEELVGLLLRSGRLAGLVNPGPGPGIGGSAGMTPSGSVGAPGIGPSSQSLPTQPPASAREAWDAWPNSAPTAIPSNASDRERQSFEDSKAMPPPALPGTSNPVSGGNGGVGAGASGYQADRSGSVGGAGSQGQGQSQPSGQQSQPPSFVPSSTSNPATSPSLSVKSPNQRPTDSKALLALAEEADELEGWSVNAVGMGMMDGYHAQTQNQSQTQQPRRVGPGPQGQGGPAYGAQGSGAGTGLGMGLGMGGYPGLRGSGQMDGYGTSPPSGGANDLGDRDRGLLGANPADQNPPINTLYVGNLPAISPPTHPPNFLEESLRALFARSPGFKRMSFRQKINGPMCFVEFEEVPYASQAIKDLYGHNLGGLVKGGIRLSYSKNSLGQRGNAHPSGINTGLFGGIAHTVALAGMTMSMTSPTLANAHPIPIAGSGDTRTPTNGTQGPMSAAPGGPGYGLQLQQGAPGGRGDGGPATAIPDLRRERESSSNGIGGGSLSHTSSSQGQSTSLSPTAQPFNIALPNTGSGAVPGATSPRSRYFSVSGSSTKLPSPSDLAPGSVPGSGLSGSYTSSTMASAVPIPGTNSNSTFHPFGQPPSTSTSSGPTSSGFSPMSSPIRTPASFSWKSSGPTPGTTGMGMGNGQGVGGAGFGFEFGSGVQITSLNGAASAWGERRD